MNDTKNYIFEIRDTMPERLTVRFLVYLIISALSFGVAFAIVALFVPNGYFLIVRPASVYKNGISAFLSVTERAFPVATALFILYAASHTVLSPVISAAISVWRGFSLGCICKLMRDGAVAGVGRSVTFAVLLYFAATVIVIFLSSLSNLYSLCICRAYSAQMPSIKRELALEYLRLFLILSGGIFILTAVATVLM